MLGAVLVALAVIVVIPSSFMIGGAVLAGLLGWSLKSDADDRHEGSELVDLNR